jgi:hypothetical protein
MSLGFQRVIGPVGIEVSVRKTSDRPEIWTAEIFMFALAVQESAPFRKEFPDFFSAQNWAFEISSQKAHELELFYR